MSQVDDIPRLYAHHVAQAQPGQAAGVRKLQSVGDARMTGQGYSPIRVDESGPVPGKGSIGCGDGDLVRGKIPGSGISSASTANKSVLVRCQGIKRPIGPDVGSQDCQRQYQANQDRE